MPRMRMTDRGLRALRTDQEQEDFYDPSVAGFVLRVTRTGRKTFYFRYRNSYGKYSRVRIGTYPELSLADAREKARSLQVEVDTGEDPAEDLQRIREAPTVAVLATEYVERYAKRRKRSWKEDERLLAKHVVPLVGDVRAPELRRRQVITLVEKLVAGGTPVQANRVLRVMSKMFNWGIEVDLIESNPCHNIRPPGLERRRDRVLTEAEIQLLWRSLEDENPVVAAAMRLLLLTGQRSGEVIRMRWSDIEEDVWTIPSEWSKSGGVHVVPLSSVALQQVRRFEGEDPVWVLPTPRGEGRLHDNSLSHSAGRIRRKLQLPHWTPHDLRRTVATELGRLGYNGFLIGRLLGHADRSITAVYNRWDYLPEKREMLERWGQRLMEIVGERQAVSAGETE